MEKSTSSMADRDSMRLSRKLLLQAKLTFCTSYEIRYNRYGCVNAAHANHLASDYNGETMRFVRIFLSFVLIIHIQGCQIIEFSDDKEKSDTPEYNKSDENIIIEKSDYNNTDNSGNSTSETEFASSGIVRPQNGFNEVKSQIFKRKYPFTNFDTRDFNNPFYTVENFLDAINSRNFMQLRSAVNNNFVFLRNIVPEDSAQFWRCIQGSVGLYSGISEMHEVNGKIHFTLKSISKNTNTILLLSPSSQSWKISNILKVIRLKTTRIDGIRKYDSGELIWQGNWDVGTIDKFEFILIKPKFERINLLRKILTDAQDGLNSVSSNFITTDLRKKTLPKFMQNSSSIFDTKFRENLFMLNFYKTYSLIDLINVSKFPVNETLQIETYIAIFDTKINAIVFVNWLVIDGVPYIERIELPTGSSLQVYFMDEK